MINYFAYGSNMCTERLAKRIAGVRSQGIARLADHSLRWHKRSGDGSRKCDAFFTGAAADVIIGVLYVVPDAAKATLDAIEGLGKGYVEKKVVLVSEGQLVQAMTYVAESEAIETGLVPYDWYKQHVICGARDHKLPAPYIAALSAVASRRDLVARRASRETTPFLAHRQK